MRTKVAILAAVIVAAILGWTAWWFVLATARDDALTVWLEDRRQDCNLRAHVLTPGFRGA